MRKIIHYKGALIHIMSDGRENLFMVQHMGEYKKVDSFSSAQRYITDMLKPLGRLPPKRVQNIIKKVA